jgi:hypothetical protein
MLDANLLFHNAATLTTSGDSSGLDVKKTAADGLWVEIVVTALAGSTTGRTLDFRVDESDNDSTYNADVTFPQITAVGRYYRRVQSKKRYLRLNRVAGAATGLSATVTAGIVSGAQRDVPA